MNAYARWLFAVAAAANLLVAAAMSLGQAWFVAILVLDPISGTNVVLVDPARYRPLIAIGAWGKLAAVGTVLVGALTAPHLWRLFALISGDVAFAALFLDYLRRTSVSRAP
jgi:hypothetical protein